MLPPLQTFLGIVWLQRAIKLELKTSANREKGLYLQGFCCVKPCYTRNAARAKPRRKIRYEMNSRKASKTLLVLCDFSKEQRSAKVHSTFACFNHFLPVHPHPKTPINIEVSVNLHCNFTGVDHYFPVCCAVNISKRREVILKIADPLRWLTYSLDLPALGFYHS